MDKHVTMGWFPVRSKIGEIIHMGDQNIKEWKGIVDLQFKLEVYWRVLIYLIC